MSTTDEISPRPSLTAAPVAVRDIHKTVVPLDNPTAAVLKDIERDLTALTTSGEFIELEASVNRFCPFEQSVWFEPRFDTGTPFISA
ncbi:hypothetical protein [Rhizobium sp. BK008]|uniref:hypothetical protein n=1 Tax=Rhizobium sp. BK008 TaxID=2587094 RepID=UPI00160A4973|nr:hypothetical protein [Rhizobium sp. BK008]MBB4252717.1 hypothetical protein [Rhizobium sp. BK008]